MHSWCNILSDHIISTNTASNTVIVFSFQTLNPVITAFWQQFIGVLLASRGTGGSFCGVECRAVTWKSWVWASQRQLLFFFSVSVVLYFEGHERASQRQLFLWIDIAVCSLQFQVRSSSSTQSTVSSLWYYLDYAFPTSPTALPCSTSLYQASPTMPCILLVSTYGSTSI